MAGPNGSGRPSKIEQRFVVEGERLARLGLTDAQMAAVWGVSEATIKNWKGAAPEFARALRVGKPEADAEVVASLFHRARGYSHDAVKIFMVDETRIDADGTTTVTKVPVKVPYVEHYPPDTTACIFWLKNRQPALWRDRVDHDITSNGQAIPALIVGFAESRPGDGAKLINP